MSHITSYANNTKWLEFRKAMLALRDRSPQWRSKYLRYPKPSDWDGEWFYHFRLEEHKRVEWRELRPNPWTTNPVPIEELAAICRHIGLEHEIVDGLLRIIGYRVT